MSYRRSPNVHPTDTLHGRPPTQEMPTVSSKPPQPTGSARRPSGVPGQPPATRRRLSRRDGGVLAALVTATFAGLLLPFLLNGGEDSTGAGSESRQFGHVHGLGVDPADDSVLAATHHGLYRLRPGGTPNLVGGLIQDFMGFTVVGPGHFLASGHPGAGQDGPSSLGLIESTDAGKSWKPVSLAGEADFHSLQATPDQIYGLNSLTGQFLASADGTTWEPRGTLPMADFAANPADPDRLVATTQNGPATSTDGGRTFAPVEGAPVLLLVDWAPGGALAGLTPDGRLYTSTGPRAGSTWRKGGTLGGAPEALHVVDRRTIYAVADSQVLVSTDGGASFTRYDA